MDKGVAQRRISIATERINAAAAEIAQRDNVSVREIPRRFSDPLVAQVYRMEAVAELLEAIAGDGYRFAPSGVGSRALQAAHRPQAQAPEQGDPAARRRRAEPRQAAPVVAPVVDGGTAGPSGGQTADSGAQTAPVADDATAAAAKAILAGTAAEAVAALADASPNVALVAFVMEQAAARPRATVLAAAEARAQGPGA